jgi:tripartite-type tricarboxylate transporter receptor subunit TctC
MSTLRHNTKIFQPCPAARATIALLAAIAATLPLHTSAQDYPTKPIRLVVPYAPGGGTDLLMRPVAQRLAQIVGQPVVVDNRGGATGIIGADAVAKAQPDGYTLLAVVASHYLQPFVSKHVPYDAVDDFVPVTQVAKSPNMIVLHPAVPAQNVSELVAHAKKQAGSVSFVTAGTLSSQHMSALLLTRMSGARFEHVAYKGGGPALIDLLAGQVTMGVLVMGTVMPQIKAGKLRPIAVVERARAAGLPEVPTVGESLPGYAMPDIWTGFLAPRGTPAAVVNRLYPRVQQALQSAEVRERLEASGYELLPGVSPQRLAAIIRESVATYRKVAADAGIKPQ